MVATNTEPKPRDAGRCRLAHGRYEGRFCHRSPQHARSPSPVRPHIDLPRKINPSHFLCKSSRLANSAFISFWEHSGLAPSRNLRLPWNRKPFAENLYPSLLFSILLYLIRLPSNGPSNFKFSTGRPHHKAHESTCEGRSSAIDSFTPQPWTVAHKLTQKTSAFISLFPSPHFVRSIASLRVSENPAFISFLPWSARPASAQMRFPKGFGFDSSLTGLCRQATPNDSSAKKLTVYQCRADPCLKRPCACLVASARPAFAV